MLGLSKMRLCVIFALFSLVTSMPSQPIAPQEDYYEDKPADMMMLNDPNGPLEDVPGDMMMLDEQELKQMLKDLFISSSRDARQLELDEDVDDGEDGDAADVADVTDDADNAVEAAVTGDSEAKASEEEVARFNNYIDAIYRRMNAALRAKMMDPMTLNLDDKQKKVKSGKKANVPRSLNKREADEEEDDYDEDTKDEDEDNGVGTKVEDVNAEVEDEIQSRTGKAEKKKNKGAAARKNKNNKNKKAKKGKKGEKDARTEKINKKAEREAAKKKKQELREKKREERKKNKEENERSLSKREADEEEYEGPVHEGPVHEGPVRTKEQDAVLAEDELLDRAGKTARDAKKKRAGAAARKNKKNKKGKKDDKDDKATKKAEREAAKKEKQEKKQKKQELREKKRAEKKKEKAGASRRQSRSGQKNKNKKKQNNNKNNKKSRNTNNKKSKSSNNKNKKNSNNKARSGNARNNQKDEKMMGSLSGIATLRREGDVLVKEEENHKVITSEFNVGPLQLEVSKMYGKGQARTVKSAKAITEVMSGTMTLKVKPDGSAHVKKVVFKEPENVDVKGSLSDNKPRNLRYLKNSVNKMRPLAAIRVLKTARYVLKSPNSSMANKA